MKNWKTRKYWKLFWSWVNRRHINWFFAAQRNAVFACQKSYLKRKCSISGSRSIFCFNIYYFSSRIVHYLHLASVFPFFSRRPFLWIAHQISAETAMIICFQLCFYCFYYIYIYTQSDSDTAIYVFCDWCLCVCCSICVLPSLPRCGLTSLFVSVWRWCVRYYYYYYCWPGVSQPQHKEICNKLKCSCCFWCTKKWERCRSTQIKSHS